MTDDVIVERNVKVMEKMFQENYVMKKLQSVKVKRCYNWRKYRGVIEKLWEKEKNMQLITETDVKIGIENVIYS